MVNTVGTEQKDILESGCLSEMWGRWRGKAIEIRRHLPSGRLGIYDQGLEGSRTKMRKAGGKIGCSVLVLLELHSQYISVGGRCRNGAGAGAESGIKEKLNDG